jgi:hypothetical protein
VESDKPAQSGWRDFRNRILRAGGVIGIPLGIWAAVFQLNLPWLLVGGIAALVVAYALWTPLLGWIAIFGDYPKVVADRQLMQERLDDADRSLAAADERVRASYQKGLAEGESRVHGSNLSAEVAPPPVKSKTRGDSGVTFISAPGVAPPVQLHTRFSVVTDGGVMVGAVEVFEIDEEGRAFMSCVERFDEAYWAALEERPYDEVGPPDAVHLETYRSRMWWENGGDEVSE